MDRRRRQFLFRGRCNRPGRGRTRRPVEREDRTASISFQETQSGGTFAWHDAPVRQFVITLSGTLDFQTRKGEHFTIRPGDILLAEDTTGSGHSWRLVDEEPWRRAYVILAPGVSVPFVAKSTQA